MTRKPGAGEGQADLFGAASPPPKPRAARPRQAAPAAKAPAPPSPAPAEDGIATLANRLSPAELDELASVLPDEALARLLLAAARQMRRRLARAGGRASPRPSPALSRAARQLAAELGGAGGSDEF